MWLAREKDGSLWGYRYRPMKSQAGTFHALKYDHFMELQSVEFPEVTNENSPIEVTDLKSRIFVIE